MPKRRRRTKKVQITMTAEEYAMIATLAQNQGFSVAQMFRTLCRNTFEHFGKQNSPKEAA